VVIDGVNKWHFLIEFTLRLRLEYFTESSLEILINAAPLARIVHVPKHEIEVWLVILHVIKHFRFTLRISTRRSCERSHSCSECPKATFTPCPEFRNQVIWSLLPTWDNEFISENVLGVRLEEG